MILSPLVALFLLPLAYAGMYAEPVVHLDAKSFKRVMAQEHAAMVAFVAPWCGHCKNLGPEYTAAAASLSPLIPFYAVDCDANMNKPLCAEYQIQGFPTIKAFPRAGKGAARDYQGERKRGALVDYAKGLVPDRVKKLRTDDGVSKVLDKYLKEGLESLLSVQRSELPHTLLIHPSSPSIPFLWKVLGHRLSSKMQLGYIRDTSSHSVLSDLGAFDPKDSTKDTAILVYWPAGSKDRSAITKYDGPMKFNPILEWLEEQLISNTTPKLKAAKGRSEDDATPVDAPGAVPPESVDDSGSIGSTEEVEENRPADPIPPQEPGDAAGRRHEEL